jgi:uncharacterized protein DUF7002
MSVTFEKIIELHPTLFHMAERGTWESIRSRGLLSTSALMDLFQITGSKREEIEAAIRKRRIDLDVGTGRIVIRDQKMSDSKLAKCLQDRLTTRDWLLMLNGKVFFWLTEPRLITLMKSYAKDEHLVLEVDTAELLKRHGARVMLAPMNTGTTSPMGFPRGLKTFLPPDQYPFEAHKKTKGGAKKAIVELTVDYSVPDIAEFTTRATHRRIKGDATVITETVHVR